MELNTVVEAAADEHALEAQNAGQADVGEATIDTAGADGVDAGSADVAAGVVAAAEAAPDGRRMEDGIKKALATMRATDPKAAGVLRDIYYELQAHRDVFGKPDDATKARELSQLVGGEEGWKSAQERTAAFDRFEQQFQSGAPELAQQLQQQNPGAYEKLAVNTVNTWAQTSPAAYQSYATTLALNMLLAQPGVGQALPVLQNMYQELAASGAAPQAQFALQNLINGVVSLREGAAQAAQQQQQRQDPERERFQKEQQAFAQRKQEDFESGVAAQVNQQVDADIKPLIAQFAGELESDQYERVTQLVRMELDEQFDKLPEVEARVKALYAKGDAAAAVTYIHGQYAKLVQSTVKKIAGPLFRNFSGANAKAKSAQTSQNSAPATGVLQLREAPSWDRVDRGKTSDVDFLLGKAVLTDGRRVTWGTPS